MNWRTIARALRLMFLLRVPLLTLLILAALGPVAFNSSYLSNLLDQNSSGWYLFTVSFAAFLLASTAVATLNLILHYGNDRFDERACLNLSQKRPLLTFFSGFAATTTLDVYVYCRTRPMHSQNGGFLLLGLLAASAFVIAAKVVQLALTDPKSTPYPPPFLIFPAYLIKPVERIFDDIYCWSSPASKAIKGSANALSQWPLQILRRAGQGYLIDIHAPQGALQLRSGHVFSFSLFALAFIAYLGIGLAKSRITSEPAAVPALAFVLLFFIVACWALTALTFFFDRYRFPLLWTIATLSLITASSPISDHFFRVETREKPFPVPPTAAEYLRKKINSGHKRLVFVATPGGGIQAAAWTAQVLTGLENRVGNFRNSVAAISSVSGGSLGSVIYAASFTGEVKGDEVAKNARRSAIDEVAWGWTVPDFWRVLLPWFRRDRTLDRGWALEKKWAAVNHLNDTGDRQGTMLSAWSEVARRGDMPALLINGMLVERGQPVVFSNTRFPRRSDGKSPIINFYDLYPSRYRCYDLRVNTAARLSASFPYVAPASRPNLDAPYGDSFHIVDGGYYDNFGVNSLLAWLNEALDDDEIANSLPQILILQIRHFSPNQLPGGSIHGWGFQLFAPLQALFHMRDFAQDSVARNQLEFFSKYYANRLPRVQVWETTVAYPDTKDFAREDPGNKDRDKQACTETPVSWKLDNDQSHCIDIAWNIALKKQASAFSCLNSFINSSSSNPPCDADVKAKE